MAAQNKPDLAPKKEEVREEAKTPEPAQEQINNEETNPKPKKKFYKRVWFWIVIAATIIVLGPGIFFGVRISQQNKNKQMISQGWHDLVLESNNVVTLGEKVTDQASFNAYSTELHKLDTLVDDEEFKAQKLSGSYSDVQNYKGFLTDFNRYVTDGARYSDNVAQYSTTDNDNLTVLSKTASEASDKLKNSTSYLTENINQKIFTIQDVLTNVRDQVLNQAAAAKAQQAATAAQAQADAKNTSLVQQATNGFLTAFVAGNAAQMRQFMTQPFQNEYDFNQLTPESRQYTYPATFRLLTTKKVDDKTYTSQANVTYKNRSDSSQYTVGQEFTVINSSGTWLINSMKEGSGY